MSLEAEITGWNALSLTQQAFVTALLKEGYFSDHLSIARAMPLLLEPAANENRVQGLLKELDKYRVSLSTAENPSVIRAWKMLGSFVEVNKDILLEYGAAISISGSVLYDDPVNLDGDVGIHFPKDSKGIDGQTLSNWKYDLAYLLECNRSDVFTTSINELREHQLRLNDPAYYAQSCFWIFVDFMNVSTMLNGDLTLSPSLPKAWEQQRDVYELMSENPLMQMIVIIELEKTLAIRKQRRAA